MFLFITIKRTGGRAQSGCGSVCVSVCVVGWPAVCVCFRMGVAEWLSHASNILALFQIILVCRTSLRLLARSGAEPRQFTEWRVCLICAVFRHFSIMTFYKSYSANKSLLLKRRRWEHVNVLHRTCLTYWFEITCGLNLFIYLVVCLFVLVCWVCTYLIYL